MKYLLGFFMLLLLVGCNDSNNDAATVTVTDVATGAYIVSLGNVNAPTVGKYYAGADGSRLLVLNNADEQAKTLYRKAAGAAWTAVPAVTQDTNISLLRNDALSSQSLAVASLAGTYITQTTAGLTATFSIAADGNIRAGSSACKLSGSLSNSPLPNALSVNLQATACGDLPANSNGNLLLDRDYQPAAFRLVTDNGTKIVDLWGYAE